MDERKKKVLKALIDDYIATAEPVGSRTLARRYAFGVGPATIRNEMADLAELGYLDQPHTSAGRVPSDKGYRFYVDQLMNRPVLEQEILGAIRATYRAQVRELHWFMHQTARLVSAVTAYPAVVLAPPVTDAKLWDLRFVGIGSGTALLVLRTDSGMMESRMVAIPSGLTTKDLHALADDFTTEFRGTLIRELEGRIWGRFSHAIDRYRTVWEDLFTWLNDDSQEEEKTTVGGALSLLAYPEFQDVDKVRRVMGFLETQAETLTRQVGDGIQVMIGAELAPDAIQDCSVVTAQYEIGRRVVGKVLVLGPRRMQYARVMTVLEVVSEELSRALHWA